MSRDRKRTENQLSFKLTANSSTDVAPHRTNKGIATSLYSEKEQ